MEGSLPALDGHDWALRLLREGYPGRVLSVHTRAVNLELRGDCLVTLTTAAAVRAPGSVRVALPVSAAWRSLGWAAGAPVETGSWLQSPGAPPISLETAESWDGRLPALVQLASPSEIAHRARCLARRLAISGTPGGMRDPVLWLAGLEAAPAGDNPLLRAIWERATRSLRLLTDAAATGDAAGVRAAAASLVGLGPGLTPSGDDLLAGLVVTLICADCGGAVIRGVSEALSGLLAEVGTEATTPVSRAMLRWAARGQVPEAHGHLAAGLLEAGGDPLSWLPQVLDHGATSGTDWVCGTLTALLLLQLQE